MAENYRSGQKNKLQENELQREKNFRACIWFERYEILEILGKGGTGTVYLARDMRLGRQVAVKILDQVTEQFREEVRILQKQGFPMLPVIFDAWVEEDGHTGVIVMEYVEGQNLREYLELHRQIPEKQIYSWGLQLGEFLQKLHGLNPKVLYRDLKPENIMVQPDRSLRLVDVGAALCDGEVRKPYTEKQSNVAEKRRDETEKLHGTIEKQQYMEERRRIGRKQEYEEEKPDDDKWRREPYGMRKIRVGTFGYASPEQWRGERVDERTDIYSLGAVLWLIGVSGIQGKGDEKINGGNNREMNGELPVFNGWQTELLNGNLENSGMPRGMVSVIRRCLREEKEKRYATAAAFLGAWKRYRQVSLWSAFGDVLLKIGKYSMLLAAVFVIWLEPGRFLIESAKQWCNIVPLYCFAGYAILKLLERMAKKDWGGWEQKKSVWCRGS